MEVCNLMLYQDQSDRCALPKGHTGEHMTQAMIDWRPSLKVEPGYRERTIREEDPRIKMVSQGDGIYSVVPTWVAEALQDFESYKHMTTIFVCGCTVRMEYGYEPTIAYCETHKGA